MRRMQGQVGVRAKTCSWSECTPPARSSLRSALCRASPPTIRRSCPGSHGMTAEFPPLGHKGGPRTISGFSSTPCSPACLPSRRAEAPDGSTLVAAGHSASSSSRAGRRECRRGADGRWACAHTALKTRLSGRKQKDPRPLAHGTPARPRLAVFLQLADFHLSSSVSPLGVLTGPRAILLQPVLVTEIHMPIC